MPKNGPKIGGISTLSWPIKVVSIIELISYGKKQNKFLRFFDFGTNKGLLSQSTNLCLFVNALLCLKTGLKSTFAYVQIALITLCFDEILAILFQ